jgi:hypothetical protein
MMVLVLGILACIAIVLGLSAEEDERRARLQLTAAELQRLESATPSALLLWGFAPLLAMALVAVAPMPHGDTWSLGLYGSLGWLAFCCALGAGVLLYRIRRLRAASLPRAYVRRTAYGYLATTGAAFSLWLGFVLLAV